MRRSEQVVIGGLAVATAIAVVAGVQRAPRRDLQDPRLSTHLAGPEGAQALRETLERVGVSVESRPRGLFDLATDTTAPETRELLSLLDVTDQPTRAEQTALVRYVELGGSLLLVGWNYGVERCFNVRVTSVGRRFDSLSVDPPPGLRVIPKATSVLEVGPFEDEDRRGRERSGDECAVLEASAIDTLLRVQDGRPVALDLTYRGGGSVLMVSEPQYFTNEALKETDAGVMVVGWMLRGRPHRVTVDEYHHGFGERSSLSGAAWTWTRTSPLGWTLLHLGLAGLVAIFAAAARFGPALEVVERRRRSVIEHVDALAVGLQRAAGGRAAVDLLIRGLRRRLGRADPRVSSSAHSDEWLRALALGARAAHARETIDSLGRLARDTDADQHVLEVAQTVEDVWEALGHEKTPNRF